MVIDFLSIQKIGNCAVYEIAPGKGQQNEGSFVICSIANGDFEPQAGSTGTINGAAITLHAGGKILHHLRIGKKSINQLKLWQLGYHIPHTVILDFSFCDQFKRKEEIDLQDDLYQQVIKPRLGTSVAVRCSSNLEDGEAQSYAGTFDTYLNVSNQLDEITERITQSYRKFCLKNDDQKDVHPYPVRLGIMIQHMLQPKFSGFLFTLDPMNPPKDWWKGDYLKIEYWQGPREESEGYVITLNRETKKRVSTGRDKNYVPLPISMHEKLHHAAVELERYFRMPQDIEFLISGANDALYLVQSRPITAFSYSPDKVRVEEQAKVSDILEKNRSWYQQDPVLSSTNITELFPRAIPLGYSIFKYGFAGTQELEGGISIGRSRLGYASLAPMDGANLFYTIADQARTNLIVDALTFRLPGISEEEYLNCFVKYYLEQIKRDPTKANYPEYGLYLQTDDPERWREVAGDQGERFCTEFTKFRDQILRVHAPTEYRNAGKFFRLNDRRYRSYMKHRNLYTNSPEILKKEINDILLYLRTQFCPQYVVYARLAFLCADLAKTHLDRQLAPDSHFTSEQILNEVLSGVRIRAELEGPQYAEFEHLYKLGRIRLVEFLYQFQHIGSLDITQPRLGEYSHEKLREVFGQNHAYELDGELPEANNPHLTYSSIAKLKCVRDPEFRLLYPYAGRFMRLREKAKSELLKLIWALKCRFIALAQQHHFSDLIYYLELEEALTLGPETREELRMRALQRQAYFAACQQYRVKEVLSDLQSMPFEKKPLIDDQRGQGFYKFAQGKSIFYGHAEGHCLKASSNDEFLMKLATYKAKGIENIVGVFKEIELSYFNVSALVGFTTEKGGYLSHAATIAREFRLPYITDVGFDQFRDEDYLVMDTENHQVIIRR